VRRQLWVASLALACGNAEPVAAPAAPAVTHREQVVVDAEPPAAGKQIVVPTRARDLRVATYNILGGRLGVDEVIAAIRSFDADLVALQEVDSRTRRSGRVDQPRVIAEALGMEVAFAEHRRFGGGRIGVALLSKHPLGNIERIALPGGLLAALRADVTIAGTSVRTFVVHFHPTDPRDSEARQKGMDLARQREADAVLLLATRENIPTIVMGDFNARSNGLEYAAFSDHFEDACIDAGATWPATFPLVRIDYVWTSPAFERLDCPRFTPPASDHRPHAAETPSQQP
jgi:endonuclease/exonuclease/phosphatase family metal-dependent hydrolase